MAMITGYQQVGQRVPAGEVLVGREAFEEVRGAALGELFDAARMAQVKAYNAREALQYAVYLRTYGPDADSTSDRCIGVSLSDDLIVPSSRLLIDFHKPFKPPTLSKRTIYEFETYGDELFQAKKSVYFARSVLALTFEDTGYLEDDMIQRKMFERAMTADDCRDLVDLLQRSARRARALRP